MNRKSEIAVCLDEIEAAYTQISKKGLTKDGLSKLRSWARSHKTRLKDLKYKGKIPRQPRVNNCKFE